MERSSGGGTGGEGGEKGMNGGLGVGVERGGGGGGHMDTGFLSFHPVQLLLTE